MRAHRYFAVAVLVLCTGSVGCHQAPAPAIPTTEMLGSGSAAGAGSGAGSSSPAPPVAPAERDLDSKEILARSETTPEVFIKHVLLAWKDLAAAYGGHLDPRAENRSNAEAAALALEIAAKLKANPASIDELALASSEDPGSTSGDPYTIKADGPFVAEFKNLAIRLHENEVGIVKTQFGYHVLLRVPRPPLDPLESAGILAREPQAGPVHVQHIVIGWKDTAAARAGAADKRATERTKADADKLATEVLAKVRKGNMAALMKQYSEDSSSKDNARVLEVVGEVPAGFESFKNLAIRLKLNEAGLAKTVLGWHVIKRVPPPPPDTLQSTAILKREPETQAAKVKHILLGWTEAHAQDERGVKRTRAELEKLVKATLAKLKNGDKIEALMAELSEDPGSASSGTSYDVTPESGLVTPFKNLSLRLKVGEVGVVKTDFGIHIIQRTE